MARQLLAKALVVCPASLREMWEREMAEATVSGTVLSQEELGRDTFDPQPYAVDCTREDAESWCVMAPLPFAVAPDLGGEYLIGQLFSTDRSSLRASILIRANWP